MQQEIIDEFYIVLRRLITLTQTLDINNSSEKKNEHQYNIL